MASPARPRPDRRLSSHLRQEGEPPPAPAPDPAARHQRSPRPARRSVGDHLRGAAGGHRRRAPPRAPVGDPAGRRSRRPREGQRSPPAAGRPRRDPGGGRSLAATRDQRARDGEGHRPGPSLGAGRGRDPHRPARTRRPHRPHRHLDRRRSGPRVAGEETGRPAPALAVPRGVAPGVVPSAVPRALAPGVRTGLAPSVAPRNHPARLAEPRGLGPPGRVPEPLAHAAPIRGRLLGLPSAPRRGIWPSPFPPSHRSPRVPGPRRPPRPDRVLRGAGGGVHGARGGERGLGGSLRAGPGHHASRSPGGPHRSRGGGPDRAHLEPLSGGGSGRLSPLPVHGGRRANPSRHRPRRPDPVRGQGCLAGGCLPLHPDRGGQGWQRERLLRSRRDEPSLKRGAAVRSSLS
jgi:hypothetical protein